MSILTFKSIQLLVFANTFNRYFADSKLDKFYIEIPF